MTHEEIKVFLKTKDMDWLESRWSALHESIRVIQVSSAEIDSAFDYPLEQDEKSPVDTIVRSQNTDIWSILSSDGEGELCWETLKDLIDEEILSREKSKPLPGVQEDEDYARQCADEKRRSITT